MARLSLTYPRITGSKIAYQNDENYDLVNARGCKTGELNIYERTTQAVGRNTPNGPEINMGLPKKYSMTNVRSDSCKSKSTYCFPNGEKYSVLKDEINGITRVRKFSDGKWKLIAYQTPDFSFASEYGYRFLEKEGERLVENVKTSTRNIGFDFQSTDYSSESLSSLLKKIKSIGEKDFFNLKYLSKGERKLVEASAATFGEQITNLAQSLFRFAKIVK